jgi:Ca2+-binding EF-hand superfamily protein
LNEKSKFHQQLHHKHELEHLYNIYVEIKHYKWSISGDGTFSFEEFVQVMANIGGISEQSVEDEEEELRQAFRVCIVIHKVYRP